MRQIERRLCDGMAARGIVGRTADDVVRAITSFALYGFPESHAAGSGATIVTRVCICRNESQNVLAPPAWLDSRPPMDQRMT